MYLTSKGFWIGTLLQRDPGKVPYCYRILGRYPTAKGFWVRTLLQKDSGQVPCSKWIEYVPYFKRILGRYLTLNGFRVGFALPEDSEYEAYQRRFWVGAFSKRL